MHLTGGTIQKYRRAATFDLHHGLCCCGSVADEIALRNVAIDACMLRICCGYVADANATSIALIQIGNRDLLRMLRLIFEVRRGW
jgi:hypothetical protein